jgi:hypothetical protein
LVRENWPVGELFLVRELDKRFTNWKVRVWVETCLGTPTLAAST